jgi:wyosine [tRNA(Phe)-imidazoG37] synthetase (radical SAM superfamily)
MKYLFGPVPSRRLGFSLGVDIIPFKTCTHDCIYCELGPTTRRTIQPVSTVSLDAVLAELREFLNSSPPHLDFITLSGSGEPTLHPDLGDLIKEIKRMTPQPVALITNSSLLYKREILERVLLADVVLPSLDAVDANSFQTINRPHPDLTFGHLKEGLIQLGRAKGPRIWLEILFLRGLNDAPQQVEQLKQIAREINPEKIQLNTVVRPPVEDYAFPLTLSQLEELQKSFGPGAEIISGFGREESLRGRTDMEIEIREMVSRRPCTAEDIALCLGLSLEETGRILKGLVQKKKVTFELFNRQGFYRGTNPDVAKAEDAADPRRQGRGCTKVRRALDNPGDAGITRLS